MADSLTIITEIVHQYDFFDEMLWTSIQNTADMREKDEIPLKPINELRPCSYVRPIIIVVWETPSKNYLTMVRNNVDRASLWNVIITLVAGSSLLYDFLRHLENRRKLISFNAISFHSFFSFFVHTDTC